MNCLSKKNIIALCLMGFYSFSLALDFDFNLTLFSDFRYAVDSLLTYLLPLIPPILIFLFMLPHSLKYKKWFVPTAFGIIALKNIYSVLVSIIGTPQHLLFENNTVVIFVFTVVLMLFNILCFIGTLFGFKLAFLLKLGSAGYILTSLAMLVYEYIILGGMEYINSIPGEFAYTAFLALVKFLFIVVFYLGIFVADFKHNEG